MSNPEQEHPTTPAIMELVRKAADFYDMDMLVQFDSTMVVIETCINQLHERIQNAKKGN